MKTRRLCAVIAAAATLLGGMAFGTAGAYAAGSASIEVRHSQKGHTYSAYKFASLTVDGDAVQVDTDADWVTAVTDAVATANNLGLASRLDEGMSDKAIQVKNVKNVTQLPLTGAMGTVLFTIAALVMAGAGLALVLRFRESDTPMAV